MFSSLAKVSKKEKGEKYTEVLFAGSNWFRSRFVAKKGFLS